MPVVQYRGKLMPLVPIDSGWDKRKARASRSWYSPTATARWA